MIFSLVIATTDRAYFVARLFNSLAVQSYKQFEVILIHEDHCADIQEIVNNFSSQFKISSMAVPKCGVSKARNMGIPLINGDYAVFPDDDCVYAPNTLAMAAKAFAAYPEFDLLLGTRRDQGWKRPAHANHLRVKSDNIYAVFGHSETYLQFYRRPCLDKIGLFDETLGAGTGLPYGCGEDTDYVLRALKLGLAAGLVNNIDVFHAGIKFGKDNNRAKQYAAGRMYLLRKHAMPMWFRMANVLYPLAMLPFDAICHGARAIPYRLAMFYARLKHFSG